MVTKKILGRISQKILSKKSIQDVISRYLAFLICPTPKKTLVAASQFAGLHKSQYSRLLKNHGETAALNHERLSKKQIKPFRNALKILSKDDLPWKVALIVDSTLQGRAYRHTQNAQRFNHGSGFVIGHQWTNLVLLINGTVIPLSPIAFHTKGYCKKNKIPYQTEHELVANYIENLKLEEYIGVHNPEEVVVLADSGYDCKQLENTIIQKGWKFIIALSKTRSVKSEPRHLTTLKSKGWSQVAAFFKNQRRLPWQTVRFMTNGAKRKRKDFRTREITAYLRHVGKVLLICSEFKKRPDGRRKYLACNDLKATARHILLGYRARWSIEIFHKDIKQYLGFENTAVTTFKAVKAHVHWVYCAYILLMSAPPGPDDAPSTVRSRRLQANSVATLADITKYRQVLTQFKGREKLMTLFSRAIEDADSSLSLT